MSNDPKPIFDGEYIAFSPFDRVALQKLVARVARPGAAMLEVGSWLGNGSTQVLIEALSMAGGHLVCVDTWLGSPNVGRHQELVRNFNVFATFQSNVHKGGGEKIVTPVRMTSAEAAVKFPDRSFDLVFIDAEHSYECVRQDIELWKSKVRTGGILCGHDCELRPGAVGEEVLQNYKHHDAIEWGRTFRHIHPGAILAVHELLAPDVRLFSEEPVSLADGTQGLSTIWYVEVSRA